MSGGDKRGERAALNAGIGAAAGAAFISALGVVAVFAVAGAGLVFGFIYS